MNCNFNTNFKEVSSIGQDLLLNILEANFKTFFDWSFLSIGGWLDVTVGQASIYGVNKHGTLLAVKDPLYTDGQVWQSIRKDWVWETGVAFASGSPIDVSGIFVDSSFLPYASGLYNIDYPNGRIIFDSPIATSSTVELNYSYRHVQTYRASDSPWFNILQYATSRTNNKDISRADDGSWSIGGHRRIQMPAIIIDPVSRSRSKPYELGNDNLVIEQDIAFHVLAETKNDRNQILDILRLQQDNIIMLYNTNNMAQDSKYPLNYLGDKVVNPIMYPNMVCDYAWRKCWIRGVNLYEIDSPDPFLHRGLARATVEIISS